MGRFYADLNRLKHDELLRQSNDKLFVTLVELHMMSPVDKLSQKQSNLFADRDGDIIMAETLAPPPPPVISPFKEKFSFEWFSFDGNKQSSSKATLLSPISSASPARKLSVSTASPSTYFSEPSPTSIDSNKPSGLYELDGRRPRLSQLVLPSPPPEPMHWIWQCHMCRNRYPLAVTRRCLVDGHYYCSGVTTTNQSNQRNAKRRKANKSCTSEFDYVGWQDWGRWTRKCQALKAYAAGKESGPILKGCEGCSFPSQCRYEPERRPPREQLEFVDYVDSQDLDRMLVDEVEVLISPERQAFEEERQMRASLRASSSKSTESTTSPQAEKDSSTKLEVESLQISNKAAEKAVTSRRQRFYAGITSSVPSMNANSARDNSQKGKFDPTLPSVAVQPSATEQGTPKDASDVFLNAIEASLKSALPSPPLSPKSATRRTQSSPQVETVSSKAKVRKRLNSKTDNPEFVVPVDDAKRKTQDENPLEQFKGGLVRSNSEQSLIIDLFRQVKGNSAARDRILIDRASRASSEADIAEFLQLRAPTVVRTTSGPVKLQRPEQNFEDIQLTPKDSKPNDMFADFLLPTVGVNEDDKKDVDPVKRDLSPTEEALKRMPEKSVTTGLGAGLFSFAGFGRK